MRALLWRVGLGVLKIIENHTDFLIIYNKQRWSPVDTTSPDTQLTQSDAVGQWLEVGGSDVGGHVIGR